MNQEVKAAVERLRGIEGPTFYGVSGKRHISEQEYTDAVTLVKVYLAGLPADDDDSADVDWLMDEYGFDYSTCGTALIKSLGGGWEVVCGVKECRGGVEVRSSAIHYVYHGPPKIEPSYILETKSTRGSIRRLLAALGVEPKGAKT